MTAELEGGEWSAARLGRTLPPRKTRHPFYRRLSGPQGRSGRAVNLFPTGIRSRTVQPVAQSVYRLSYLAHSYDLYIYISSNNVRHPVTKTFTTLHYTSPNYGEGHELSMAKHLKRITLKGEHWLSRFLFTKRCFKRVRQVIFIGKFKNCNRLLVLIKTRRR